MANLSLTRVNQKLMQAKVLLQHEDQAAFVPVQLNSRMEAAAFHLVCAYQHYLREITETYGVKNIVGLRNEEDLVKAFESAKKYPSEARELMSLRTTPASWLSQLHAYYDSLWRTPVISEAQSSENLIAVYDPDADHLPMISLDLITEWHHEFVALVLRQRETSAEF